MEAKDTTKTYGELKTYCADKGIHEPTELDLREAQAEISFKAGIREVVEWVEHNLIYIALELHSGKPELHLQTNERKSAKKWQAKLKEWGIK